MWMCVCVCVCVVQMHVVVYYYVIKSEKMTFIMQNLKLHVLCTV